MNFRRKKSGMLAHPQSRASRATLAAMAALPAALLVACGGSSEPGLPQLAAATPGALQSCSELATRINFPNTTITAANPIAEGTLTVAGTAVRAHCQITGKMHQRVSSVDGKSYAIGFEMRLPNTWNGRFFYQGNGGIDGNIVAATGAVNGGAGLNNALNMGFAVISSDAGHEAAMGPNFGIDPQARLDYGYQAVAKLTPMAKSAIQTAYGKGPDRSYFGGCSNGGRHTMVAASRFADQYDGYLVGNPGFNLPKAAIANIASGKIYFTDASTRFAPAKWGGTFEASVLDILEQSATGRVLEYDPATRTTRVVAKGLSFANGLALSRYELNLFVNETGRYRVWKIAVTANDLDVSQPSEQARVLFDNLPGYPDNLMRGQDGRIWLGFAKPRNPTIDKLADKPFLRSLTLRLPRALWPIPRTYGHVMAFTEDGQVVADLQDPGGTYPETTAVTETHDRLYIQSLHARGLGWLPRPGVDAAPARP